MTNLQIIFNEAVENKIFTEEEALEIIEKCGCLPLHTFAGWKAMGYSVKKGQKAKITTKLWKFKKEKVTIEDKKGNKVEEESKNYYLCKAYLFTADQVEKTQERKTRKAA